jgi:hypothetical protein
MDEFDTQLRAAPEWADWESNRNYEYAVVRADQRYPVKQIVSMATGTPKTQFGGGPEANSFVQKLGFTVEPARDTPSTGNKQIFVFTASNAEARANLRVSIDHPIASELLVRHVGSAGDLGIDPERAFAWGAIPGSSNTATWEHMTTGDYVLTVVEGRYLRVSSVVGKIRQPELARAIWGSDQSGNTWELIYFLTEPKAVDVPVRQLGSLLRTQYFGFTRIGDDRIAEIGTKYGSVDAFIQAEFLAVPAKKQAWVFAGLSTVNDFSKLPVNEPFTWTASAHRDRIQPGDRAYIYRFGSEAAIVAVASVLEAPRSRANLPAADQVLLDASRVPEVTDRVALKLDLLLQNPITKSELVQAGLQDLAVLKAQGGSTFRVDPAEEAVIERLIAERTSKTSLASALEGILAGYPAARRSDPFSGSHPLFKTALTAKQLIDSSPIVAEWPNLITRVSFGRGNWASVPWLAIMDERETTTTRRGIYCVYLFREDGSGVYLTMNQGVTEPRERLGGAEARTSLRSIAHDVRANIGSLADAGFSLDDRVDLRATSNLGEDYELSTIAHKLYPRGEIPSDDQLFEDLRAVVAAYESVLEARHPQPTPVELSDAYQSFAEAVTGAGLSFGTSHEIFLRAFVASLITKPLVILTGLSGSGKTQLALKFGEWLGEEYSMVVPVRPDWTGPEALFGYVDALKAASPDGRPSWFVPDTLDFMLTAARNPDHPYLLVLDEMNLAHVERYFADFLSGVESRREVLPNLIRDKGEWRVDPDDSGKLKIPRNLFVVGTVNVDETTYMFSPKVLDRANTIEFRVQTSDLPEAPRVPTTLAPGPSAAVVALLQAALDDQLQDKEPAVGAAEFAEQFRALHEVLSRHGAEFGYRSFYEATRFAAVHCALGDTSWERALDLQVMQKILPRLHGGRRKMEPILVAIGLFCFSLTTEQGPPFDPADPGTGSPRLPISFGKVQRMTANLRANQFVSFSE